MRAMKNTCLIFFSVAAFLLLTPATALSCTCDLPSPGKTIAQQVRDAGDRSKAVFAGQVVEVVDNPQASYIEVKVRVDRSWKNVGTGEVNLRTGRGGYCGYPFEVGESYLVYAYEYTESELGTNICQRTMKLADAGPDLDVLGIGNQPGAEVVSAKPSPYTTSKVKRISESRRRPPAVRSESSPLTRTPRRAAKATTAHIKLAVKSNARASAAASAAVNAGGLIALGDHHRKGDVVNLYNKDGSLWLRLDFNDEKDEKAVANAPRTFKPFAYHPDYFLLALRYVGRDDKRFEVVVNEETGLRKYVRADDTVLKFQTWEEHILKAFAVDFDSEENQVLETPGGKAKRLKLDKAVSFHPVEMEGEWVKVRWNRTGGEKADDSGDVGWIRWRKEGVILIELFYFA